MLQSPISSHRRCRHEVSDTIILLCHLFQWNRKANVIFPETTTTESMPRLLLRPSRPWSVFTTLTTPPCLTGLISNRVIIIPFLPDPHVFRGHVIGNSGSCNNVFSCVPHTVFLQSEAQTLSQCANLKVGSLMCLNQVTF